MSVAIVVGVLVQASAARAAVRVTRVSAHPAIGGGAQLSWTTTGDSGLAGFDVMRVVRRRGHVVYVRATRFLLAGKLVRGAHGRVFHTRRSYRFFDPLGRVRTRYQLRSVGADGLGASYRIFVVRGRRVRRLGTSRRWHPITGLSPLIPPGLPPAAVQALLSHRLTVRVTIAMDGWYRIPLRQLAQLGLPVKHPKYLHLFVEGREQAAMISGGALEFYGRGLESLYTSGRVYFVDAEVGPGLRMTRGPRPGSAPNAGSSYSTDAATAPKFVYFSALLNGDASNFFGPIVTGGGTSIKLNVPHLAQSGGATLNVVLQGVTTTNHVVDVALNGRPVGQLSFAGMKLGSATFAAPGLVDGANTIALKSSGAGDLSLLSSIDAHYEHTFKADAGALSPSVPGGSTVRIGGFDQPDARMLDVSDPLHAIRLRVRGGQDGSGNTAQATVPGGGQHKLFAFTSNRVLSPAKLETAAPAYWNTSAQRADLIVITTPALAPALASLVTLRRREGLTVDVIPLSSLLDEFSYGERTPFAIHDFLAYAHASWARPPRYVLLGGAGTHDPHGYLGGGTSKDVIPVKMVDTQYMEAPSDTWLSPDMAIGRLPARTPAQMSAIVAKIRGHTSAALNPAAVLANGPNSDQNFPAESQALVPLLPANWTATQITDGDPGAHQNLLGRLNQGPALVNYTGHGSVNSWSGLLDNADADSLANERSSLYVIMTCLNGYFTDPNLDSLGERLLESGGGAYAVWASSAQTDADPQVQIDEAFMRALFPGRQPSSIRIGDAVRAALSVSGDPSIVASWTLLGDPTSRLVG